MASFLEDLASRAGNRRKTLSGFYLIQWEVCIMRQQLGAFFLGTIFCISAISPVGADDPKHQIKGGIEGKVMKVDVEGKKLIIAITGGRDRSFAITDETMMFGPNGGKVRRHLKDPRFREGFPVIIVADGNNAEEVHLGFAKDATGYEAEHAKVAAQDTRAQNQKDVVDRTKISRYPPTSPAEAAKKAAVHKEATKLEDEDDESEIPGHVKSFDSTKRILVITLFNGKTRSFLLAHDVPVHIKGATAASRQGLEDHELKAGAFVTVVTDDSGHKVKELKVVPASEAKRRKAG
jgi:hypothetical protein